MSGGMRAALEVCADAKLIRQQLSYDPERGELRIARSGVGLTPGRVVGSINSRGYVIYRFNGKSHKLHRLAWLYFYGQWPEHEIDHINCVKTDNRIANLRDVPKSVNLQNRRSALSTNKSKILGAHFMKDQNKWRSGIRINGRLIPLGVFTSAEQAGEAYLKAKRQLHQGCTI